MLGIPSVELGKDRFSRLTPTRNRLRQDGDGRFIETFRNVLSMPQKRISSQQSQRSGNNQILHIHDGRSTRKWTRAMHNDAYMSLKDIAER